MSIVVGLTGGIASGKSTVSKMFLSDNIPVIDTDLIAHELLQKGTPCYLEIVKHFSKDILFTDDEINRKKLGNIIFANEGKREILNSIVHPLVLEQVEADITHHKYQGEPIIVIDVPLLFESGFDKLVDKTIVVYTEHTKQIERLTSRDNITKEYAQMKINAQLALCEKVDRADYVINNSFSVLQTKKEYKNILEELEVS